MKERLLLKPIPAPLSAALMFLFFIIPFSNLQAQSEIRQIISFNKDWKFYLGQVVNVNDESFDEKNWRRLDLPHDWSIEGKFDKKNPAGAGGAFLPGGLGWYRKSFFIPESSKNKNVFIDFDGVYRKSEVWINGHSLGMRPNGYISFRYDLTPYLKYGNGKNFLVVKVDNTHQPNSRWYSGSGIYRNVWLVTTGKIFVDHWGTYITTPVVNNSGAAIDIYIKVKNTTTNIKPVVLSSTIFDASGVKVAKVLSEINARGNGTTENSQTTQISKPHLWSVSDPYLYKVVTQIIIDDKPFDEYVTRIGIRSFKFDRNQGFLLNGNQIKINGVCDHHDLGCLGAAVNKRALERKLEILKAMGCNGIRTTHNPPAPELLDLCDKMGFIVMDEAFDMWKQEKTLYDYHLNFETWHKKDLEDQVLRDRNHASVFIWSIGNEIQEEWATDNSGSKIAMELSDIVRSLDMTRPITSALNNHDWNSNSILRSGALNLVGYNYDQKGFASFPQKFPGKNFIGTETVAALETRGHYDMPSDSIRLWPAKDDEPLRNGNKDLSCSSYDAVSAPWGSTHEGTWKIIKKYPYLSGQFIWTGFDYLGEPTPYEWPAHSSYFGIIDLAGFPKDVYYMYQSEWTDKTVLHIFPHWNWKKGKKIDVWAYYNHADEVELFLNGKSLGIRSKKGDDLHVMWRVVFEPGTLKAVSRKNGKTVLTRIIKTSGKAAGIILSADRNVIQADASDVSFIKTMIVDASGNPVPEADNLIKFSVSGPGTIAGTDNGNEADLESMKGSDRRAFNGLCLAVIQSKGKAGNLKVTAASKGLSSASLTIIVK